MRLQGLIIASIAFAAPLAHVRAAGSPAEDFETQQLLDRYQDATRTQMEALKGGHMEVEIDAKLTKLEKHGRMHLLRNISKLGSITYKMLGFSGDSTIKKEVIARYLESDTDPKYAASGGITPANYKFHLKATILNGTKRIAIFEVKPKKKSVSLFEGELWLDFETGMPVRESGKMSKSPSVFVKKLQFVREYEIREGIAYPKRIESQIDVRVVGRAEVSIEFSNFSKEAVDEEALVRANQ